MNVSLSEKLKSLRKEKNVSQEKLAEYLGVSFQAVSKWENGNTLPDILLLPDIARFYGITIDELLQVEKIDEQRLVDEFEDQAEALCRNGDYEQALELCKKMYKKMPNNIEIKEHLMSLYYDVDKIKYQNEIIDLGNEIYNMDHPSNYYKGQVCNQLAVLYSYLGKEDMAEKWADKSFPLHHSTELIYTQIFGSEETIGHVSWCMYWFLDKMYWMAAQIVFDTESPKDAKYKQNVFKTVSDIFEVAYKNDDMSFEMMKLLYIMHKEIAKFEVQTTKDENVLNHHLTRCLELSLKSRNIKEHTLKLPMLDTWKIQDAPSNNMQVVDMMRKLLTIELFDEYKEKEWFINIKEQLNNI